MNCAQNSPCSATTARTPWKVGDVPSSAISNIDSISLVASSIVVPDLIRDQIERRLRFQPRVPLANRFASYKIDCVEGYVSAAQGIRG